MATVKMERESEEYLRVSVTASVTLSFQPVELAITSGAERPSTWMPGEWEGEPASTRIARVEPGWAIGLAPGTYVVWARVTDAPEIPVINAGKLALR